MTEVAFTSMIAAVGLPGFLLFVGYKLALRYGFFDRDDGQASAAALDKLSEKIDRMTDKMSGQLAAAQKESEREFRGLRDRMTRVETILEERSDRHR